VEIKVKYVGLIKTIMEGRGEEVVDVSGDNTVKQLVYKLADKHGERFKHHVIEEEFGRIRNNCMISVDGEPINWFPERENLKLEGIKEVTVVTIGESFLVA
jgi:uncharacterized protein with ATP-grasp and redox domains